MARQGAFEAVSELLRPLKTTIHVTPSVRYQVSAPCLLRQLAQCVAVGTERGGRGVPGSRAPLNTDALDLWHAIAQATHIWARALGYGAAERRDPHDGHPIPWVGRLMRYVVTSAVAKAEEDMVAAIERKAKAWTRDITALVTGEPEQRGVWRASCPECQADRVVEERDGEHYRVPAIVLVVRAVGERPLRWLSCRACGWYLSIGEQAEGLEWRSETAA